MKLIVDIPEEKYNQIINSYQGSNVRPKDYEIAVINGTPIPDNATNGDVMKAIFKPNRITRTDDTVHIDYDITPDWWNAPYQKGGKECR